MLTMSGNVPVVVMFELSSGNANKQWELSTDFSSFFEIPYQSMALSSNGKFLVIGGSSPYDNYGAVQVFQEDHSSSPTWVRRGNVLTGEGKHEGFGYAVDITYGGNMIALGVPSAQTTIISEFGGVVGWTERHRLRGRSYSLFGRSVSMTSDGSRIVVGSPYSDGDGISSAYFYDISDNILTQKIDSNSHFGHAVVLSSDGSVGAVSSVTKANVRVYMFDPMLKRYVQVGNEIKGDFLSWFGYSIDLSEEGKRIAIGAPSQDTESHSNSGKTFVYSINTSANGQEFVLIGEFEGEGHFDHSGWSVSLSGDGKRIAIGAKCMDAEMINQF